MSLPLEPALWLTRSVTVTQVCAPTDSEPKRRSPVPTKQAKRAVLRRVIVTSGGETAGGPRRVRSRGPARRLDRTFILNPHAALHVTARQQNVTSNAAGAPPDRSRGPAARTRRPAPCSVAFPSEGLVIPAGLDADRAGRVGTGPGIATRKTVRAAALCAVQGFSSPRNSVAPVDEQKRGAPNRRALLVVSDLRRGGSKVNSPCRRAEARAVSRPRSTNRPPNR